MEKEYQIRKEYQLRGITKEKVVFTYFKNSSYFCTEAEAKAYVCENQYPLRKEGIEIEIKIRDVQGWIPADVVWDLIEYINN